MLVTQERPRQRTPRCRAAITSSTVDIPTTSAPSARAMRISAGVSYDGPGEAQVHALARGDARLRARLLGDLAQVRVVGVGHVGEARAQRVLVGAGQRVHAREVDVVGEHHQLARLVVDVHAAGRVREHERLHAEARQHADGEHDLRDGGTPRRGARVPPSPRPERPRPCPSTSSPRWPTAVEGAKCGISPYGIATASAEALREGAQARAEHEADGGRERRPPTDEPGRLRQLGEQ